MTRIRIMCDQTDGTTIKLGAIETDKTGERIDAMSCELIDPLSGGVK